MFGTFPFKLRAKVPYLMKLRGPWVESLLDFKD